MSQKDTSLPASTSSASSTVVIMPCHPIRGLFDSVGEATAAIDSCAALHGYAVATKRSRKVRGEIDNVVLACDRHGTLRNNWKLTEETRKKAYARSRKCNCPMEVLIRRDSEHAGKWNVEYNGKETEHNHTPSLKAPAHPTRRRIQRTPEIIRSIQQGTVVGERAAVTLAKLRREQPGIQMTARDVYNVRQHSRTTALGNRSAIQHLLELLSENASFFCDHGVDAEGHLDRLSVASLHAVNVFKANCDVIIMDCTYKTNRFGLPLLNIIGCTGMNTTVHLAQCYLRGESEDDFEWALGCLCRLHEEENIPLPQVIITDRDEALLNALETHWNDVPALLCLWHIFKDVQAHVREHRFHKVVDESKSTETKRVYMDSKEHTAYCTAFVRLTEAPTEGEYTARLEQLRLLDLRETLYVEQSWLDIWKTRIVHCWTKRVTHFGMQTTSRVEGDHAAMKRWLLNSTADLLTIHDRMTVWSPRASKDCSTASEGRCMLVWFRSYTIMLSRSATHL